MELNKSALLLLLLLLIIISSPLLSFFTAVDAICVPRNGTFHGEVDFLTSPPPSLTPAPSASSSDDDNDNDSDFSPSPTSAASIPALQKICSTTNYPETCVSSIAPFLRSKIDPVTILKIGLQVTQNGYKSAIDSAKTMSKDPSTSKWVKSCLIDTCLDVFDSGMYDIGDAQTAISDHDIGKLKTVLSSLVTYPVTCDDCFTEEPGEKSPMVDVDQNLTQAAANNLAFADALNWQ